MRVSVLAIGAGLVASATAASSSKAPACVNKCWEYTKYVSTCDQDTACLCEDSEYQNAVYQCLYSQCPTAYFANALHHTLAICSSSESDSPALIRQEGLKKRQDPPSYGAPPPAYGASSSVAPPSYGSSAAPPVYGSGSASVTRSATRSAGSGSASVTRSAGSPGGSPARGSPTGSVTGSAGVSYSSGRANPTGGNGGNGGNGGSGSSPSGGNGGAAPAPTFTGAAAIVGSNFGVVAAAGVAALAALA